MPPVGVPVDQQNLLRPMANRNNDSHSSPGSPVVSHPASARTAVPDLCPQVPTVLCDWDSDNPDACGLAHSADQMDRPSSCDRSERSIADSDCADRLSSPPSLPEPVQVSHWPARYFAQAAPVETERTQGPLDCPDTASPTEPNAYESLRLTSGSWGCP